MKTNIYATDLQILCESLEEEKWVFEFIKNRIHNKPTKMIYNVKGNNWFGKSFYEIAFRSDLKKELERYIEIQTKKIKFRILDYNEVILEGDEAYDMKSKTWVPSVYVGEKVKFFHPPIRREMLFNYRLLNEKEIVKKEDEYYDCKERKWLPVNEEFIGFEFYLEESKPVRRKLYGTII